LCRLYGHGNVTRLDRVSVFGDALSFLIPHDWIEGQGGDDHYLYHLPQAESGWLRVSLISIEVPKENLSGKLDEIFEGEKHVAIEEQTGNRVCTWEKDSQEDGVPIRLFYWKIANAVPPDLVREAIFSYAVLSNLADLKETRDAVDLIGRLVSQAQFCRPN
jgi:hypothetical protein